ncbi:uncharacterized protein [Miscanthus floridulus]|uniref:uncharacterized protein isoform X4 n=1 Tax=Miscanthus floridulus TaxID=154761 RepID=UPI00345749C0
MRGGGGGSYARCLWGHPAARGGAHGASRWTETAPTSPVRWERGFGNMGPLLSRHGFIVESFRLHFLTIGDGQGCHCCLRLCNPGKLTQLIHQSKSGRLMYMRWLDTSYCYSKQLNRKGNHVC